MKLNTSIENCGRGDDDDKKDDEIEAEEAKGSCTMIYQASKRTSGSCVEENDLSTSVIPGRASKKKQYLTKLQKPKLLDRFER